jgi:hypothetical protein
MSDVGCSWLDSDRSRVVVLSVSNGSRYAFVRLAREKLFASTGRVAGLVFYASLHYSAATSLGKANVSSRTSRFQT